MAETAAQEKPPARASSRRDFLSILTMAGAAVISAAIIWPMLDALNPDAKSAARAYPIVNVADIPPNGGKTVDWNGVPVIIRRLTHKQMDEARAVAQEQLPDPASFMARVNHGYPDYVVVVGLNTGTACALEGNDPSAPRGPFGGWVSPCDGSQYDALGRLRAGPAPRNLAIPPYHFINAGQIQLGRGA